MESPPSCSAWRRVNSSRRRNYLYKSSSLSSGLEYVSSEEERGSGRGGWVAPPPVQFRDTPPSDSAAPSPLRPSTSHNSLSVPGPNRADDSSFITSAMSHDTLAELYNVPLDSDIYTIPVDSLRPRHPPKKQRGNVKKRRRQTMTDGLVGLVRTCSPSGEDEEPTAGVALTEERSCPGGAPPSDEPSLQTAASDCRRDRASKRQSAPPSATEPVHMTLQEVRQFLQTLYNPHHGLAGGKKQKKRTQERDRKGGMAHVLKETLCNMFRRSTNGGGTGGGGRRGVVRGTTASGGEESSELRVATAGGRGVLVVKPPSERALPPLPSAAVPPSLITTLGEQPVDFTASIQKVKDYGWYWGPISGEAAEKVLSNEPDGSFIVRDSSDHHYIFSLTFRLNGCVRHVRIEHDQGNFSFGSCTKFKSQTIVEFIETAVEHSRSGRYLFFLHRRPVLGPMRVQLLHPVSRFKHVQSLQHLSRFVIVKTVRRDLIPRLPLPRRLIDYLNSPHYYSEQLPPEPPAAETGQVAASAAASPTALRLFAFTPPRASLS